MLPNVDVVSKTEGSLKLKFSKILLPLDLEWPSMAAVHQASLLARHFNCEIVVLYAVRHATFLGVELGHTHTLMENAHKAEEALHAAIVPEFAGITSRRIVVKGDPARAILETAVAEKIDLIVMGPHARPGFAGKLMGSVTHNVLNSAEAPIWSAGESEKPLSSLAVHTILCGADFTPHDRKVVQAASDLAGHFGAKLILAHVTPGVEIYGPGGFHEIPELKKTLVSISTEHLTKLRKEMAVEAELFTGSGDVSKVLDQAARHEKADLVVIGRRPSAGMLGGHAYRIIAHSHVPVLSV